MTEEVIQPYEHQGSRDEAILLMHGFTGTAAHMRPLAEKMASAGYTVRTINLPGHATRAEDMAHVRAEDWIGAARDAMQSLHAGAARVTACGLSMGACLSLLMGAEGLADRVISISCPMPARNRFLPFVKYLYPLVPSIRFDKDEERIRELDQRYDFGYELWPSRAAAELYRVIRECRAHLSDVVCPLLCVQSHADMTIAPGSADFIMQAVRSPRREMFWLEGVPHVCTISRQTDAIAERMIGFLQAG
jgi:carboxylesterase